MCCLCRSLSKSLFVSSFDYSTLMKCRISSDWPLYTLKPPIKLLPRLKHKHTLFGTQLWSPPPPLRTRIGRALPGLSTRSESTKSYMLLFWTNSRIDRQITQSKTRLFLNVPTLRWVRWRLCQSQLISGLCSPGWFCWFVCWMSSKRCSNASTLNRAVA